MGRSHAPQVLGEVVHTKSFEGFEMRRKFLAVGGLAHSVRTIKEDIATTDLGDRRLKEVVKGRALANRGVGWLCDGAFDNKTAGF
ncbi:hypothetical protein D3C87_1394590 [compost metagenome]